MISARAEDAGAMRTSIVSAAKPPRSAVTAYGPGGSRSKWKMPWLSVVAFRAKSPEALRSVTVACATTAPEESLTTPSSVPIGS